MSRIIVFVGSALGRKDGVGDGMRDDPVDSNDVGEDTGDNGEEDGGAGVLCDVDIASSHCDFLP